MAFGFFKKVQAADIIFHNGHIYTHDPDFPWADAVACQEGRITAVGDFEAMEQMQNEDTRIVDLNGKYLFPGFIDVHRSPVQKVFAGRFLDLSDCRDAGEICMRICSWAESHDDEVIFGYGYREDMEPSKEDLDGCCADRPILLLCTGGLGCAVNSAAEAIITETAEEECVEVVTVSYVLNLLVPFNFEEIEEAVAQETEDLCDKGITTVLNQQTPDYFEGLYQDSMIGLYNEGKLKQRFFGSLFLNRPLNPRGLLHTLMRRKTNCNEMGDMIQAKTLNLYLDEANCPMDFSQDALNQILLEVCDKGFDLFIEAIGQPDLEKTYQALELVRNKGYKNLITIASDCRLPEEMRQSLQHCDDVLVTWGTCPDASHPSAGSVHSVEEAISEMTVKAAAMIGMQDDLGMIEKGRIADFCVFEENPLKKDLRTFAKMHADMTVLDGQIVYDVDAEQVEEMYDIMSSMLL